MLVNKHVFLGTVVIVYTLLFLVTFDTLHNSIQITSIALIGLCGWFYGTRVGLFSILFFILLNASILFVVSGQLYDILVACHPLGLILSMISAIMTGSRRETQDELNEFKGMLTSRVDQATYELNELAQQLIEKDEADRIRIGQDLHDGAGQYLTGMLLHSESLAKKLSKKQDPEAAQVIHITKLVQKNIFLIRDFAQSLLPNHLTETGFNAAMEAMVDFFRDANPAIHWSFRTQNEGESKKVNLHLYRIAQESIFCLLNNGQPQHIDVDIDEETHGTSLRVTGRGCCIYSTCEQVFTSNILKYRAQAIQATLTMGNPEPDLCYLQCIVKTQRAG